MMKFLIPHLLLLQFFTFINIVDGGAYDEYYAVKGDKVGLACNSSHWYENSVSLVLWYREFSDVPIYTLDVRESLSKSHHIKAPAYKDRTYFDTSINPPRLVLDNVTKADEGLFRCRVDYRKDRTENFFLNLTVYVPPSSTVIMDAEGHRLEGVVGPFEEGTDLLLICESEGGDPPPQVKWWRSGQMIDDTYTISPPPTPSQQSSKLSSSTGFVRNELQLSSLSRNDLLSVLTCQSSANTDLMVPQEVSVSLDLILEPIDLEMIIASPTSTSKVPSSNSIVAFERTEIICKSKGSRPEPVITWRWKKRNNNNNNKKNIIKNAEGEEEEVNQFNGNHGDNLYIFDDITDDDDHNHNDEVIKRRGRREERRREALLRMYQEQQAEDEENFIEDADVVVAEDVVDADDTSQLLLFQQQNDDDNDNLLLDGDNDIINDDNHKGNNRVDTSVDTMKRKRRTRRKDVQVKSRKRREMKTSPSRRNNNNNNHNIITSSESTIIRQTSDGNLTISTLSFIPSPDDNEKIISCRVTNPSLTSKKVSRSSSSLNQQTSTTSIGSKGFNGSLKNKSSNSLEVVNKLNVFYAPQVKIMLGAQIDGSNIREGSDVYFECIIKANPWISEVTWYHEGSSLYSDPSSGIIISNQSLVLQRIKKSSRGKYSCSAINNKGQGKSQDLHLRVQFAPVCKSNQQTSYGIGRNEGRINIICSLESDPSNNVTFRWFFNDFTDKTEIRNFITNGSTSIASFIPSSSSSSSSSSTNFGKMICFGENHIGRQKEPCIFNIIPASSPDPVTNCTIKNASLTLIVTCLPGESGGLRQTFFMEVYDVSSNNNNNINGNGNENVLNDENNNLHANISNSEYPRFLLTNINNENNKFNLHIYSSNSKGKSSVTILTAPLLTQSQKQTHSPDDSLLTSLMGTMVKGGNVSSSSNSSLMIMMAVGGSGLILCIISVLILVCFIKNKYISSSSSVDTSTINTSTRSSKRGSGKRGRKCSSSCSSSTSSSGSSSGSSVNHKNCGKKNKNGIHRIKSKTCNVSKTPSTELCCDDYTDKDISSTCDNKMDQQRQQRNEMVEMTIQQQKKEVPSSSSHVKLSNVVGIVDGLVGMEIQCNHHSSSSPFLSSSSASSSSSAATRKTLCCKDSSGNFLLLHPLSTTTSSSAASTGNGTSIDLNCPSNQQQTSSTCLEGIQEEYGIQSLNGIYGQLITGSGQQQQPQTEEEEYYNNLNGSSETTNIIPSSFNHLLQQTVSSASSSLNSSSSAIRNVVGSIPMNPFNSSPSTNNYNSNTLRSPGSMMIHQYEPHGHHHQQQHQFIGTIGCEHQQHEMEQQQQFNHLHQHHYNQHHLVNNLGFQPLNVNRSPNHLHQINYNQINNLVYTNQSSLDGCSSASPVSSTTSSCTIPEPQQQQLQLNQYNQQQHPVYGTIGRSNNPHPISSAYLLQQQQQQQKMYSHPLTIDTTSATSPGAIVTNQVNIVHHSSSHGGVIGGTSSILSSSSSSAVTGAKDNSSLTSRNKQHSVSFQ